MICRRTEKRDRKLEIKRQQPIAYRNRLLPFVLAEKECARRILARNPHYLQKQLHLPAVFTPDNIFAGDCRDGRGLSF